MGDYFFYLVLTSNTPPFSVQIDNIIIQDIFDQKRHFLPGKEPTQDQISDHFRKAILIDGLDQEEAYLILSTLPANASKFYLAPLDKGLSGAKVFACKYDINGNRASKAFVVKLGPLQKIKREYEAIENFVNPHLHGILSPIFRRGDRKGLVIQELAGLTANSTLLSLKQYIREKDNPQTIVDRLFRGRLGNWYQPKQLRQRFSFRLDKLFDWHLKKAPRDFEYPDWGKLKDWTEQETGCSWRNIEELLTKVRQQRISSPTTIVHGDLHSQNILIDENKECFPIDFYWCRDAASPLLDLVMLECSIKFLVIPHRADLRSLMGLELALFDFVEPTPEFGEMPYHEEIRKGVRCIAEIRKIARDLFEISFDDYRLALWMMTYVHNNNPSLNRPYLLSSLQILSQKIMPILESRPDVIEASYAGPYDHIYASKEDRIVWGNIPGRLLKKVKFGKNAEVLDIGCGDGLNSLQLENLGCDVTGLDVSGLALEGLRRRFGNAGRAPSGEYHHIDVADFYTTKRFDALISYGIFHCLPLANRVALHTRIQEYVKVGGHVLFCSLLDGIQLPDNHSDEFIFLASEEEVNELFPADKWNVVSVEIDTIDDKHPPLVGHHQHRVKWIVARKIKD